MTDREALLAFRMKEASGHVKGAREFVDAVKKFIASPA
jgi:hypothetical protein